MITVKKNITYAISKEDFKKLFSRKKNNTFTAKGKEALYLHFMSEEEDYRDEVEIKPRKIFKDYKEYANIEDFQKAYNEPAYDTIEEIGKSFEIIRIDNGGFIVVDEDY